MCVNVATCAAINDFQLVFPSGAVRTFQTLINIINYTAFYSGLFNNSFGISRC